MGHTLGEKCIVVADAGARGHTDSACDTCSNVRDDATIQVRRHHDIELGWVLHQLHRAVIHNHLLVLDEGVVLGDRPSLLQEQSVNQFHDIGLVDDRNLLPIAEVRELECVLDEPERFLLGGDLE